MMLSPQVGKSGVNHRLRKLSAMADELREKQEENYYDQKNHHHQFIYRSGSASGGTVGTGG